MNKLSFTLLLLLSAFFLLPSCEVEVVDEDDSGISDLIAGGYTDADEIFISESSLVEKTNAFGDEGYFFYLYDSTSTCSSNLFSNVSFFVRSTADPLEKGTYEADGPFITNTSFFNCEVVITEVSSTTISGKVKGGNPDGDKWIEGSFDAEICN